MTQYIFSEIDLMTHSKERRWWFVECPGPCEKDFYRQVISIGAFMHGSKDRCWKGKIPGVHRGPNKMPRAMYLYHGERRAEYNMRRRLWQDSCKKYKGMGNPDEMYPPISSMIRCVSVWDFYKAIGYDHKRNKYETVTLTQ